MPMYDYACDNCGYEEEKFFHMEDKKPDFSCPKCSGILKRKIGLGVLFKIPPGWGEKDIDFSKRPSRRKQYY